MTSLPDVHPISVLLILIAFVWIVSGEGRRKWLAWRLRHGRSVEPYLGDCVPLARIEAACDKPAVPPDTQTSGASRTAPDITLSRGGFRSEDQAASLRS